MDIEKFPLLRVNGTAFERGKQIGKKAEDQINHNLRAYKEKFKVSANIEWDLAKQRGEKFIPWIQEYDPEIFEEIKGISEGSGNNLEDIVVLNSRSEIILDVDGCTSLAAVPPATSNGETLLGQNWDWGDIFKPGLILLEIEQPPRPTILMVTEAGIVGKIGMNNSGLGVCLNLLGTNDTALGVPIHILLRGILNSKSINQAIGQINRQPRGVAANFLIAHQEGETLDIETSPKDYDILYPDDGQIAHANHLIGPRHINIEDIAKVIYPDTHLRQGRSSKLLAEKKGDIDENTFKEIFTDHVGFPDGICRHGEEYPTDLGRPEASNTVFSIIMNLTKGFMKLTSGQPCSNHYNMYSFK